MTSAALRAHAAILLLAAAPAACDAKDQPAATDAGPDAPTDADPDGAPAADLGPGVPAVDFTVNGCDLFDPTTPTCRGSAPLTLSFIPITSANVSRLFWDFGDLSSPSSDSLPSHTYTLPGSYPVTLTGVGPSGQVWKRHDDLVVVTPNAFGDACDLERQCDSGLSCLCGLSAACPDSFARGMCTRRCEVGGAACPDGGLCADLAAGAVAGTADDNPWRQRHCLRSCATQSDCPAGQRCRLVPSAAAPEKWERACFYGFPADLGAACRSGSGAPQNHLCLGGLCADLGALGVCSLDCTARPCPEGLTCAAFNDGRRLCLRACDDATSCREDRLLACAPPAGKGPLAFTVAEPPAGRTFCAPRPCTADADCAPAGVCRGDPGATHCVRM